MKVGTTGFFFFFLYSKHLVEMVTHSSVLAWRILWMEETGRLQSMGRKELDTTERLTHTQAFSGASVM